MTIKDLADEINKNNQQLIYSIKEFKEKVIIEKLELMPNVVNKSLAYIEKLSQISEWREKLEKEVKRICHIIEARVSLIESNGTDSFEKELAKGLLENICTSYKCLKDFSLNFPQTIKSWRDHCLRLEQQVVCKVEAIDKALKEVLAAIDQKALDSSWSIPNKCYISHARTSNAVVNELWIQHFLEHLRAHLRQAGINALLASKDDPAGGNPYQYMDQIKESDYVIVVGTESLFQQHQFGVGEICNELVLIEQKRKQRKGNILPILLSGCLENTLPSYLLGYSNIANWREHSYVVNLKKLLANVYKIGSDNQEYPQIWSAFEQKYFQLVTGFSEEVIRSRLDLEEKLRLQQKELNAQQAVELLEGMNENKFNQLPVKEPDQADIITWETLIHCVKAKYIQEDKFKTVLGKAQEISSCYVNLAIVEEKEQKEKEKKLLKEIHSQKTEKIGLINKGQTLEREERLNSYEEIHESKTSILPQDIFNFQNGKELKRQLILGRAGIGKSTLCQYFAYQWAKEVWWTGASFKLLVGIPLRELTNENVYPKKGKVITFGKLFYEQYKQQLKNYLLSGEERDWINLLDKLIEKHKSEILYVLDGFDEVANVCQLDGSQATRQTEIFHALLTQEQVVITSRPYYIDHYLTSRGIEIGRRLENVGFVNKDIMNYIQYYPWQASEQQKTLQSLLNSNSLIRGIAHIPINLALLCYHWCSRQRDHKDNYLSLNLTRLYEGLIGDLLYEHLGEQSGKGYIKFDSENGNEVLENKSVQPILIFLEKLAFLQMQEDTLLISQERVKDLLKELRVSKEKEGFKKILGAGLLVSPANQEKRFEEKREHYFIHLTFQEFLAARYIARLFKQDDELSRKVALLDKGKSIQRVSEQSLEIFMQDHKYDLRYEIVWWFVAGLLEEHREGVKRFFNNLLSEPRELLGYYDVLLWIRCLEESKFTDNLSEVLKKDLIQEIKKTAQLLLDVKPYNFSPYISNEQYSRNFFDYLYSSPIVYEKLGILKTEETVKEALNILKWQKNLPLSVLNHMGSLLANNEEKDIRSSVLFALSNQPYLPTSVLKEIVKLMNDENSDIRCSALKILDEHPNLPASVLIETVGLLSDKDLNIRCSALKVLAKHPNLPASVLKETVGLLSNRDSNIRCSALEALAKYPNLPASALHDMVRLLIDKNWNVKQSVLQVLLDNQLNLPEEVYSEIIKLLSDKSWNVRCSVLKLLDKQLNLPVSVLLEIGKLLNNKDLNIRYLALCVLSKQQTLPVSILDDIVTLIIFKDEDVKHSELFTLDNSPILFSTTFNSLMEKFVKPIVKKFVSLWVNENLDIKSSALKVLNNQLSLPVAILIKVVDLLGEKDEAVRYTALSILGKQSNLPTDVLNYMVSLLLNQDRDMISLVLTTLNRQSVLPVSVMNEIIKLISDEDPDVRNSVQSSLDQQSNLPVSIFNRMVKLLSNENWNVKGLALFVLNKQPNLRGSMLDEMVKLLSDENSDVRGAMLFLLNEQLNLPDSVVNEMAKLLNDENSEVRGSARFVLGERSNLSVNVLNTIVNLLNDKNSNVKSLILELLSKQLNLPIGILNDIKKLLNDEDSKVRSSALYLLSRQPNLPVGILNDIRKLLNDEDSKVRSSALYELSRQPNLPVSVLNDIVDLSSDKKSDNRNLALEILGKQSNLSASILNDIVKLLNDEDSKVRSLALSALSKQPDLPVSILNEMIRLLSIRNSHVRASALKVLGEHSDLPVSVLNEMVRLLHNRDSNIKIFVQSVLGRQQNLLINILSAMVSLLINEEEYFKRLVLEILGKQQSLSISILNEMVRLLADKDWNAKSLVLSVLSKQANLPAGILSEMVRLLGDEKEDIKSSVLSALGKQANLSASVLSEMVKLLGDEKENVRSSALSALDQWPNLPVDALNEIVKLLDDERKYVKSAVLKVLSKQQNLSLGILNSVMNCFNNEKMGGKLNNEEISFVNLHLVSILSEQELRSKLILKPALFDAILDFFFPSKNIMYLKTNQILIVRLGQQFKQISLNDNDQFVQVFAKQRKAKPACLSGILKFEAGDYIGAITDFTEALNLGYFYVEACYFCRGCLRVLTSDYLGAIADLSKVVSFNSRNAATYCFRAWAYLFLSNIEFALKDVEQALQLDNNLNEIHVIRSLIYFKQDKLKEAMAVCEGLIKSKDCENLATFLLAQFYRFQGNEIAYQTELAKIQKLINKDPIHNLIEKWMFPQVNDALAIITNQLSVVSLEEEKELYEQSESSNQNDAEGHDANLDNSPIFTPSYQSQLFVLTPNEGKQDELNYQPSYWRQFVIKTLKRSTHSNVLYP